MKALRQIGSLAFVLGLFICIFSCSVLGLGMEDFGERPVESASDWPGGLLTTVQSPGRVYWQWVNGDEIFCYKGVAEEFNEFLKKFTTIEKPTLQLYIEPSYKTVEIPITANSFKTKYEALGKVESFHGKEIVFDWRLDIIRLGKEQTKKDLYPKITCYIGKDGLVFKDIIVPDNIETVVSDEFRNQLGGKWEYEEALKWRIAKRKWGEFIEPYLAKQCNRLKKTWPKGKEIPIGSYVEFQSPLVKKFLPDYKIYIIETNIISVSNLFAVSTEGKVFDLKGGVFSSMSGPTGTFKNEMFSDFIRAQQIVVSDENSAMETGKFIEELVFSPRRWGFIKGNSNNFKIFKTRIFAKSGTVDDPDWKWYSEKCDNGWIVSRRFVGPPTTSTIRPPRWKLILNDKNRIIEVMH